MINRSTIPPRSAACTLGAFSGPAATPITCRDMAEVVEVDGEHAVVHHPDDRPAVGVEEPAARVADGVLREEGGTLGRGQVQAVEDLVRGADAERADPDECDVGRPGPRHDRTDGRFGEQRVAHGVGVQQEQAADQLHDLHPARLVDRHRRHGLQGRAPREPDDLVVAQRVLEPLRRQVAGRVDRSRRGRTIATRTCARSNRAARACSRSGSRPSSSWI